ncbi:MAG TPA: SHOCT domain-containing protein [Methanotrichaceae archaeon]|nr:SHOCT domain-containing protein [Methanotrichaceae archaeon]
MPYYHIMHGLPFMGLWSIAVWIIFAAIAYLVYKDAEKRSMNGLLWGLPVLVPWIGIIFLALYLVLREERRHSHTTEETTPASTTPEAILDERYARGEITREQYMQMKEDLKSGS